MTFGIAQEAVVVDASAAVAFVAGDPTWAARWTDWTNDGTKILAPSHFAAEIGNALNRSARLSAVDAAARLERVFAAGIETADRGLHGLLGAIELADRHGLSVYDALYIDLALDVEASIATLDRGLASAARAEGVEVLG